MKRIFLVNLKSSAIFIVLISAIFANDKAQSGTSKYKKITLAGDVLGEAASDGTVSRGAISYALGSNGGYTLRDEKVIEVLTKFLSSFNDNDKLVLIINQNLNDQARISFYNSFNKINENQIIFS